MCICTLTALNLQHTHITYNTLSIYLAISLRVIVIFVEYDFICRCHYAVDAVVAAASCLPPFYLIRNTNCFPIFRHFNANVAFAERKRKRWIDPNRICQHTIITSDRRWHSNRSIQRIILMQNTHQHTNIDRHMSAHSFNNRFHVLAIIVSICISKCLNKYYSMNVKCSFSLAVVLLFDERNVERWSWFLRYKYAYVWLDSTPIPLYHPVCASAIAQFYVSIWYLLCFVMWMRCSNKTHTHTRNVWQHFKQQ